MHSTLILAMQHTVTWSPKVSIMMITCCLFSVIVGRFAIKNRGVSASLGSATPSYLQGFGVAEMLGTMSFGHILGAGMILGMANAGLL
jgi:photosystem I subunit X